MNEITVKSMLSDLLYYKMNTPKVRILLGIVIIYIISYVSINGLYRTDDHNLNEPTIDPKNWSSFLSPNIRSTMVSNFCIFKQKKEWRTKQIQYGNFTLLFNLLGDNDIVSKNIYIHSTWETKILQRILHVLHETTIRLKTNVSFLDIGSNIGWFTTIIAKHGYNTISFEPMNDNIAILSKNLCDNQLNPIVFHTALGDTEGKCWLISGDINKGDGIVVCDKKPLDKFKGGDNHVYSLRQEINVNLLDNYLNNDHIFPPITVMKIDVEGFEERVFKGGIQWLKRFPPYYIFMEFFLSNKPEFIQFLYELGYFLADENCENPILLQGDILVYFKVNPHIRDVCFINKILLNYTFFLSFACLTLFWINNTLTSGFIPHL